MQDTKSFGLSPRLEEAAHSRFAPHGGGLFDVEPVAGKQLIAAFGNESSVLLGNLLPDLVGIVLVGLLCGLAQRLAEGHAV